MTGVRRPSEPEEGGRPEGGRQREGSHRLPRWALRIGAGALGLLVVLYGGAALLLHTLLDPEALASWVEPRAEAALNRDVELEGVSLRIFPHLAADVRGVRVGNLPGFEGPPLAEVGSVRLQVAVLPLFRGRIRVDEVRVVEPAVHLAVDAEGRANYGDLVPEARADESPEEARPPLELAVRRMTLRGGRLSYLRATDSVRVELPGLRGEASVERSAAAGWRGEARAGSDSLVLAHPVLEGGPLRLEGPGLEVRGSADAELDRVEVREGLLRLADATLDVTGEIEGLKQPVRQVDLAIRASELDIGELAAMVPEAAAPDLPGRVGGTAGVDLSVEGRAGPDVRPEATGTVTLGGVGIRGSDGEGLVDGLGGRIELAPGRISAREISGSVLGGPFRLDGSVDADSTLRYEARIEARPRLETVAGVASLPEGVRLAGRLDARLEVGGEARRPEALRIDGRVEASGLRLDAPALGVPVTVDRARLDFRGRRASWGEVVVGLGEDRISTSGTLDDLPAALAPEGGAPPRLDADLRSAHLDLDAAIPPEADADVTYGRIAFAHLGGRQIRGRTAAEWADRKGWMAPDSLPLAGEARLRIDTLRSAPHRLTDVRARLVLSPDLVELRDASFRLYGGSADTRLSVGAGGDGAHPFAFGLEVRDVVAADFLEATSPLGRYVRGTLSLGLEVAGEVDDRLLPVPSALAGSGRLQVRDGGLAENPLTRALAGVLGVPELASPAVTSWSAPFRLEGPRLLFTEASLATALGEFRYGGAAGLDGGLDLGVGLALPAARLDSMALDRSGVLSAVAGGLRRSGGSVTLGLGVGGTLEEPSIRPRSSLVTDELRRALEGEIDERTRALRDSARARVDEARDTVQARVDEARDTVRARVEEARDTAAERLEAERREAEERLRREAEEAREELQDRARDLLRGLGRPRDTSRDTARRPPEDPRGR